MARSTGTARAPSLRQRVRTFVFTSGVMAAAASLCLAALALALALASYNQADPSFDTVTGASATNWMGGAGAWIANLLFPSFGLAAVLTVPEIGRAAWREKEGE